MSFDAGSLFTTELFPLGEDLDNGYEFLTDALDTSSDHTSSFPDSPDGTDFITQNIEVPDFSRKQNPDTHGNVEKQSGPVGNFQAEQENLERIASSSSLAQRRKHVNQYAHTNDSQIRYNQYQAQSFPPSTHPPYQGENGSYTYQNQFQYLSTTHNIPNQANTAPRTPPGPPYGLQNRVRMDNAPYRYNEAPIYQRQTVKTSSPSYSPVELTRTQQGTRHRPYPSNQRNYGPFPLNHSQDDLNGNHPQMRNPQEQPTQSQGNMVWMYLNDNFQVLPTKQLTDEDIYSNLDVNTTNQASVSMFPDYYQNQHSSNYSGSSTIQTSYSRAQNMMMNQMSSGGLHYESQAAPSYQSPHYDYSHSSPVNVPSSYQTIKPRASVPSPSYPPSSFPNVQTVQPSSNPSTRNYRPPQRRIV